MSLKAWEAGQQQVASHPQSNRLAGDIEEPMFQLYRKEGRTVACSKGLGQEISLT